MPELAEVEYNRKQWDPGRGQTVLAAEPRHGKRVFRETDAALLARELEGKTLLGSEASGKQMLFRFSGGCWLGASLGMTGGLRVEAADFKAGPHDHLVLRQRRQSLVFADPRQFGRLRLDQGAERPAWWRSLAPPVLSREFSAAAVAAYFARRAGAPVKAVLLMQERFPGVGNWMADEILWRGRVFPKTLCGALTTAETRAIWRQTRWVSRTALATIGRDYRDPPASWLFPHRWAGGGKCPRDGAVLSREEVGGRATCWCPECQPPAKA
jgi:formamidopyrimidine-DNA glycosylase